MKSILVLIFLLFLSNIPKGVCQNSFRDSLRYIQFIFCGDSHYGLQREFRGEKHINADEVNHALIQEIISLSDKFLPEDAGIKAGENIGKIDFIVNCGDITNRMEDHIQSASVSWNEFIKDWGIFMNSDSEYPMLYLLPGNHDLSNAVGHPKGLSQKPDDSATKGIYHYSYNNNFLPDSNVFDISLHRFVNMFSIDGFDFILAGLWIDSYTRDWIRETIPSDNSNISILFAHTPPEVEARHFTNPKGGFSTEKEYRFENILNDVSTVPKTSDTPVADQRALAQLIKERSSIKAYFHGHNNYNEFYKWYGPDKDIALNVFRVDSSIKGNYSSLDENLLSFHFVVIDKEEKIMTVREVLWNNSHTFWGQSINVDFKE